MLASASPFSSSPTKQRDSCIFAYLLVSNIVFEHRVSACFMQGFVSFTVSHQVFSACVWLPGWLPTRWHVFSSLTIIFQISTFFFFGQDISLLPLVCLQCTGLQISLWMKLFSVCSNSRKGIPPLFGTASLLKHPPGRLLSWTFCWSPFY